MKYLTKNELMKLTDFDIINDYLLIDDQNDNIFKLVSNNIKDKQVYSIIKVAHRNNRPIKNIYGFISYDDMIQKLTRLDNTDKTIVIKFDTQEEYLVYLIKNCYKNLKLSIELN